PYPTAFVQEGAAVEHGAPYAPLFGRYGIRCAFLPTDDALTARLHADGWRALYADAQWTVLDDGRIAGPPP
ncbi:MAG TPA: hypothetical protein VLT58_15350, partial [Polyangia bacterium]|nr:hypothetical protein [Polyangia bacterium]